MDIPVSAILSDNVKILAMSENEHNNHIVPYRVHAVVLLFLLTMTFISVAVTSIELGPVTVTVALVLATIKSSLVLTYFMHLRFDKRLFAYLAIGVILLIGVVIYVTLLDYIYR
jgi:cytochrome c oxidase subunit 4